MEEAAWVLRAMRFKIHQGVSDLKIRLVVDLIDVDNRKWKDDTIKYTFCDSDVRRILCIPLARFPHDGGVARGGIQGVFVIGVEPLFVLYGKFGPRGINGCVMDKKDQGQ
ncbi:hypothetical protein Goklo_012056, partial [Gossypium klotzschianum]|nr:hypothetical protein [Gossypium klotzschianum]